MMFEVREVQDKDRIGRTMINANNIAYINDLDSLDSDRHIHPEYKLANCAILMMNGDVIHVKETMNELAAFFNSEDRRKK